MAYKASNNGVSTLASAISSSSQTTVTVQTGHGARFPVVNQGGTGQDWTRITVQNAAGTNEIIEIVRRDAGSDVLTVGLAGSAAANAAGRGAEGTTATTWSIGDVVECRPTAAIGEAAANAVAAYQGGAAIWAGTAGGSANALTLTLAPAIFAYAAGQSFVFQAASTNSGATTAAVSGLATKAIQNNGSALSGNEIVANRWYRITYDGAAFQLSKIGKQEAWKTTVASATTPDIWTGTGDVIDYTGTTTSTGFAAAPHAGARRILVCAGASLFTHGANFILPGSQNYTTAAGDIIEVVAITTTQFRMTITKADGTAVVAASGSFPLTVVSGTTQTAVAGNHYVLTNVAATTVTLPASPAGGDAPIGVTIANGIATNVIARNAKSIEGLAEDMTLNVKAGTFWLRYVDNTQMWRLA